MSNNYVVCLTQKKESFFFPLLLVLFRVVITCSEDCVYVFLTSDKSLSIKLRRNSWFKKKTHCLCPNKLVYEYISMQAHRDKEETREELSWNELLGTLIK